jgi:FAD:protein FMN transferase
METIDLRDSSLSVSAVHGKSFSVGGVEYGHVIDPRTGIPAGDTRVAAVTGPSATVCDAVSTALLVFGKGWLPQLRSRFVGYGGFVASG